jgi:hypothetical protein
VATQFHFFSNFSEKDRKTGMMRRIANGELSIPIQFSLQWLEPGLGKAY